MALKRHVPLIKFLGARVKLGSVQRAPVPVPVLPGAGRGLVDRVVLVGAGHGRALFRVPTEAEIACIMVGAEGAGRRRAAYGV